MKVMFYTCGLSKGGAERILVSLANELSKNYDVVIVTNYKSESAYKIDSKISIYQIDKNICKTFLKRLYYKISFKRTKKLNEIITSEKPDVILAFLSEPSIRLLKLKRKNKNLNTIICIRNHPKYEFRFLKLIRNYYYKYADKIIVQSSKYISYLPHSLSKKIEVIPNFITDDFVCENKEKRKKKIVSVARLEHQKNLPLLILAYFKIKNYGYNLYIYGEGKEKNKLKRLIKKYKLENNVFLKGNVNDIKKEIEDASIFVSTSNYEGCPNAILEAMALSIPVITTYSTEELVDIINDKGIIVPKKNVKELVKALKLLIENGNIRTSLTDSKTIKEKYNKEKIIKKWEEVINSILN